MRLSFFIRFFILAVLVGCLASAAAGATSPALRAKQAQAKQVLAQISAIDEQLSVITERYDSASVELGTLRRNVRSERASLTVAQAQYRLAQRNAATLLVHLYKEGQPSTLEVMLGAKSVSDLIGLSEAQDAVSREDKAIVTASTVARARVKERLQALEADRTAAAGAVKELAGERDQIEHGLAQRRKLLASVQTQITQIEARQRAEQQRLAAEARARLAAERAALARRAAEQAARVRRAAEQRAQALAQEKIVAAARAAAQTTTTTAVTTTTPVTQPASTTTADPTTTVDPATSTTTNVATVPLPAGHPAAAQIALQYIGVPYLWAGESPSGFDCSGLVSYVFAQLGVALPHSAADQYGYGVNVPRDQLQPGDLVFFDNLNHVGIYIGGNEIINAPDTGSFVRIDSLSEGWYANHYTGARRV